MISGTIIGAKRDSTPTTTTKIAAITNTTAAIIATLCFQLLKPK
jgi:hypothetical protein